jgi:hypothetical protein
MTTEPETACEAIEISEGDILEAMREIEGYIDISPAITTPLTRSLLW